ncbi:MAG: ubiE/COQ5 methyltransferase family protein [Gammaproteobacteria bacterium]|jgi:ubiquinone/menaquinone biosynthesis C-methylase UbiE|nr:ubiE/COQ5 methyltransferase family protein [Gammaproteobacteria bacterium]
MFKDYFSGHAHQYSSARPTYPDNLFEYLITLVKGRDLAWDCATGNGQAAVKLAPYFKTVVATDASNAQLAEATPCSNVHYRIAVAEASSLESHSVDLITVAQAVHWFDFDKFYSEAKRVLKPDGIIAVWCYVLFHTDNDAVNQLIHTFYNDIVGQYWPPERKYLDEAYKTLPFPFTEILPVPEFAIVNHWSGKQIINYLQTWSGVKTYEVHCKENPVEKWLLPRLADCITDMDEPLTVTMPLVVKIGL